jgi:adenylate cyclase class IV
LSEFLKVSNDFASMFNYQDVTLKARVSTIWDMEARVVDLGAIFIGEDHQHDIYFTCAIGNLNPHASRGRNSKSTHAKFRYLDKLVDELAKGKKIEQILRSGSYGTT